MRGAPERLRLCTLCRAARCPLSTTARPAMRRLTELATDVLRAFSLPVIWSGPSLPRSFWRTDVSSWLSSDAPHRKAGARAGSSAPGSGHTTQEADRLSGAPVRGPAARSTSSAAAPPPRCRRRLLLLPGACRQWRRRLRSRRIRPVINSASLGEHWARAVRRAERFRGGEGRKGRRQRQAPVCLSRGLPRPASSSVCFAASADPFPPVRSPAGCYVRTIPDPSISVSPSGK